MPWYVLYTKPRNEKKTASLLQFRNIEVYCPVQHIVKQWSDRKKKIEEPVFRSYIFIRLEDYKKESVDVLTTPGAVRFLWWQGRPGIVQDHEIDAIKRFLGTYQHIDARIREDLKPGEEVKILSGPLRDQKGDLIQIRGQKAYLKLTSLGIELVAEVPVQSVEPAQRK